MVFKNPFGKSATGVFYCLIFIFITVSTPLKADPFLTTDQNPFSLVNGLPLPFVASLPDNNNIQYHLALEITNTLNSEVRPLESILLDYEAYHLKTGFTIGLDNNWAFKINMPFIYRGGGGFDKAIDNWHDFFNLPRANRPNVTNNQFHIQYTKNGTTQLDLTQPDSQLGDMQLSLGKQLNASANYNSSIWATIELPTGDVSALTGNDDIDLSVVLSADKKLNSNWEMFGNVGLLLPGKSPTPTLETASQVWFGHLGLSWSVLPEVKLQIQTNAHSNIYENTNIRLLNDTYEFIFGGHIRVGSCSEIEIAISEDIKVGAAPDISLLVGWRSQLGC